MENATEAIYMAFAVLVFTIALTVCINMFNKARATADAILYNRDDSNFIEYITDSTVKTRVVGLETVIPTLYRYYKENYTVIFKETNVSNVNINDKDSIEKAINNSVYKKMYESKTIKDNWKKDSTSNNFIYDSQRDYGLGEKEICSFDLSEETARNEPRTGSVENIKKNIEAFINGGIYKLPSNGNEYINYADYEYLNSYQDKNFIEQMGEYVFKDTDSSTYNSYTSSSDSSYTSGQTGITIDGEYFSLLKKNKKRVIIYTILN